jgi:hypothetical protein
MMSTVTEQDKERLGISEIRFLTVRFKLTNKHVVTRNAPHKVCETSGRYCMSECRHGHFNMELRYSGNISWCHWESPDWTICH